MISSSKEYITELFSSFERRISRNSLVHISWVKTGFYENFIQKSEPEKFKIQKKKETKRDKSVSGEDRIWGLERVKPMMYLYANLDVNWNAKIVGKLLQNSSVF